MKAPLISAIVSTHNAERFMRGCLEDLGAQTIADKMEVVIVDSASPQNERGIVEEFQQRYDNIVYVRTPMRETTHAAFTRCAKLARGKYLTLACTDDRHKPDALERMAAVLDSRPDIALVYANSYITFRENETFANHTAEKQYRWTDWDPYLLLNGCFMGPQPMWRKSLHEKYGYFDGDLESAGDWEFWLRLAERETFLHIDEFLGLYLFSETSSEHQHPEHHRRECAAVRNKYVHREADLLAIKNRRENRTPADNGICVLVVSDGTNPARIETTVNTARRATVAGHPMTVRVVREHADIPENAGGVTVSPPTPTAAAALVEAAAWEAKYVVLLSPDVVGPKNWLRDMVAVLDADAHVAAAGPLSDNAPSPQRLEGPPPGAGKELKKFAARIARENRRAWEPVPCLGGFCLLLRAEAVRRAGDFGTELPLATGLWSLFERIRATGSVLAVAKGVYVHHEELTAAEGADYDGLHEAAALIETHTAAAREAMEHGDCRAAADRFKELSETVPDFAGAHVGLGTALTELGEHGQAAAAFKRALELVPDDADVHSRLGVALHETGDLEGADASWRRAVALKPGLLDGWMNLIAARREKGDCAAAAEAVRQALAHHPKNAEVLNELALLSIAAGGAEGARSALEHIESFAPHHPVAARLRRSLAQATA